MWIYWQLKFTSSLSGPNSWPELSGWLMYMFIMWGRSSGGRSNQPRTPSTRHSNGKCLQKRQKLITNFIIFDINEQLLQPFLFGLMLSNAVGKVRRRYTCDILSDWFLHGDDNWFQKVCKVPTIMFVTSIDIRMVISQNQLELLTLYLNKTIISYVWCVLNLSSTHNNFDICGRFY